MTPKSAFAKICKNLNSYQYTEEFKKGKKLVEASLEKERKQDKILRILKKYPKWAGSLGWLLRISRYWKEKKKEITKELLEVYDIPFSVDEFATIVEWLEEEEQKKGDSEPL